MRALLLLPSVLLACSPAKIVVDNEDTSGTSDNGGDNGASNGGDSGANGGDNGGGNGGDSGSNGGDDPGAVAVTDMSWRLHDDIESMVYATWTQDTAARVHVEFSFDDGVWASTPSFDAVAGVNEQLIVGIPYETDAEWRVVVEGDGSTSGPTITTGDLPRGLPVGEVTVSEPDLWLPGANYILTSMNEQGGGWTGGHYWTFIMDRQARVVWAHEAPDAHWTLFVTISRTRDYFMWDEATYWSDWDDGAGSTIHKTYLDKEIEEISAPGLHHTFLQLPDMTMVWGSQDHGGREALVQRVPGQKDETVLWTCQEDWPHSGDCESNGLFYNQSDDSFLYSFYTNNSIVQVDHQTGESMWWAGEVQDGYAFDPPGSQYNWQHGITYTDTGSLLVSSEYNPDGGRRDKTYLLEYTVDHDARTLHEIWENSSQTYASTNGDAWRLTNGNTLHVVGAAGVVREVAPDGNDVWRVDYHDDKLLGRGEYIEDLYTLVSPRE